MAISQSRTEPQQHTLLPDHLSFLLDTSAYPHPVKEVTLLQTHISWVFLTGSFAYKVKKPVNFGFLDFSTLQQRKQACMDELRLNRRLAPSIYLDLLSIYKVGNHYLLGSADRDNAPVADYMVQMVQFDQHDLFDRRLTEGTFNPEWMDQLAVTVADFHLSAETSPTIEHYGDPDFLLQHILENLSIAERHSSSQHNLNQLRHLSDMSRKTHKRLDVKLKERQQCGHIRDCHGDLHLKNITLYNGQPTLFDCIEFSDEFRMIDTMNDAAFLVMDCDSVGRSDLGYRFLSRYLEQFGDYAGLELLPLYLSYRAGVRGKVSLLLEEELLEEEEASSTAIKKSHQDAAHYFVLAEKHLAEKYLDERRRPELIAIGGLSGSGKSHLALLALKQLSAVIIRSDATRKRIIKDHPELPIYGNEMHQLTYRAMFDAAATSLRAGFSVILDATFLHPESRERVADLAAEESIPLTFYWLDISHETLRERVQRRSSEAADISDADLGVLEAQISRYERPSEPYIIYIDSSGSWPPMKKAVAS